MEKQHLVYFKIENFKRFDSFEMSNLGQFNLIVGDNNIGKTSVLEALLFDENINNLTFNYWISHWTRGLENSKENTLTDKEIRQTRFWESIFKQIDSPIKVTQDKKHYWLEIKSKDDLSADEINKIKESIISVIPEQWIKLHNTTEADWQMVSAYFEGGNVPQENDRYSIDSTISFLSTNLGYRSDLLDMYYAFVNPNKNIRKEIEDSLRLLIPKVEEIRPHRVSHTEIIGVTLYDSDIIYPLTYFGDGTVKYFRLLLEVLLTKGKRLMVDEIGAGIHFTRLTSYWKNVIQLCAKYEVQLFATTHSLECQRAFVDAIDDLEMRQYQKDARNISLIENKQGEVKAITYDFEQFEYALNIGFNTRGGKA